MNYLNNKEYAKELYHHGILGMKWGKKNGPPYHLDAKDHSASEKKAGWRKSLSKDDGDNIEKKDTKEFKKRLKSTRRELDLVDRKEFVKKAKEIQKKYKKKQIFNDDEIGDQYQNEISNLWKDLYKKAAIERIGKDPVTKGYEYVEEFVKQLESDRWHNTYNLYDLDTNTPWETYRMVVDQIYKKHL